MTISSRAKTVQPYPAGTKWTFSARRHDFTQTQELVLYAEPDGSAMSDDYRPEETSATELWKMWADKYANYYYHRWPDLYRAGEVAIYWSVTLPTFNGVFEAAPNFQEAPHAGVREDFLTHYTHPVNAETGERLNWLRLPVLDRGWNETAADKGGFIQEATGWKPSPFQRTMDVVQIARVVGLHVPTLH